VTVSNVLQRKKESLKVIDADYFKEWERKSFNFPKGACHCSDCSNIWEPEEANIELYSCPICIEHKLAKLPENVEAQEEESNRRKQEFIIQAKASEESVAAGKKAGKTFADLFKK